eukprot:TRINITY_DN31290_c0_g1_i2.p1 TRINITY_DN31290_c0_g1~~TRINITY_DN31290_c0_g1_i2.p1  ORF type:complete len:353 (+),score=6.00 TRINITY_DN31290_c0_g1_i2:585-1643(+)
MILTRIIFCYFADGVNTKQVKAKLREQAGYVVGTTTLREIYNDVRRKIHTYYDIKWSTCKLGGLHPIEMDESKFTSKFNKSVYAPAAPHEEIKEVPAIRQVEPMEIGEESADVGEREEVPSEVEEIKRAVVQEEQKQVKRKKTLIWGIGIFERGTGKVRVFANTKRDFNVIKEICRNNIKRGTTIYTDGWKAYPKLNELGYNHIDIRKQEGFKKEPLSTSKIEGTWAELKTFARLYSKAIPPTNCDEYLREFLFRRECRMRNLRMALRLVKIISKFQLTLLFGFCSVFYYYLWEKKNTWWTGQRFCIKNTRFQQEKHTFWAKSHQPAPQFFYTLVQQQCAYFPFNLQQLSAT